MSGATLLTYKNWWQNIVKPQAGLTYKRNKNIKAEDGWRVEV